MNYVLERTSITFLNEVWGVWRNAISITTYRYVFNDSWYYGDSERGVGYVPGYGFFRLGLREATRYHEERWEVRNIVKLFTEFGGLVLSVLGLAAISLYPY